MEFTELQRKMQLAKSANKAVQYKSRSAEDILDKFKSLGSDWVLTLSDDIKNVGDTLIFISTAICKKGDEEYQGSHAQPVTSSPNKMMSPPQYQGAVSSYARKYALQGLFAMGESDFDQMPSEVTTQQQPKPKATKVYSTAQLVSMAMKLTGEPESTFQGMTQEQIKMEVNRIKKVKNIK